MNDQTGMPPVEPQNPNSMPPAPPDAAPPMPPNAMPPMPPDPMGYQPQGSYGMPGAKMGTSMANILLIGVGLAIITLIIPIGIFKIGSPVPCGGERLKNGECVVIDAPGSCTPKVFNMESTFLTCKMIGAFAPPEFTEIEPAFAKENAGKAAQCKSLNDEIRKNEGFKCFAIAGMFKPGETPPDALNMAPLEVQKLSVLSSVSDSVLKTDMFMTILIMLVLMGIMGAAAYMAHKKNIDGILHVAFVFLIGILFAYLYRYFAAGFYQGDIVVLLVSLLGAIPLVAIVVAKTGRIGKIRDELPTGPAEYKLAPPEPEPPVITEALSRSEATRFERMAMEHTPIHRTVFTIGFILLVMSLIPIGLTSMGKSTAANEAMQQEARVSTLMRKSSEEAASSEFGMEDEAPQDLGMGEIDFGGGDEGGGDEGGEE